MPCREMAVDNSAFVAPSRDCFSTVEGHLAVEAIVGVCFQPRAFALEKSELAQ